MQLVVLDLGYLKKKQTEKAKRRHSLSTKPPPYIKLYYRIAMQVKKTYRAFFASSTTAAKAAGSLMAISDRDLRFISTPAFFRPFIKRE